MIRNSNFNLIRLVHATQMIVPQPTDLVDGHRHRELLTRMFHTLSFGDLAVDGLFLLSGFLIVQRWQETLRLWIV